MNEYYIKIVLSLVLLLVSLVINYFLLKKYKKSFKIAILISIVIYIEILLFDFFIFKSSITDFFATNILLSFLLSVTFEDIKTKLMDTRVILGYFILFLIYRIIFLDLAIFLEGFIGFALSLIVMFIGYFIRRNSIGIGDIEVISACGMIIGFPNIFHFLFKTFLFVFIYGIYLYIRKKASKKNKKKKEKTLDEIPLAPFLLLATII